MQVELLSIFTKILTLKPRSIALVLRNRIQYKEWDEGKEVIRHKLEPNTEKFSTLLTSEGIRPIPIPREDAGNRISEILECDMCIVCGEPYYSLIPIAKEIRERGFTKPLFLEITSEEANKPRSATAAATKAREKNIGEILRSLVYLTKTRKNPRTLKLPLELPPEQEPPPPETKILTEGKIRSIRLTTKERNTAARKRCIEHYGTICVVCGYDFEAKFGALGRGLIHIHHLTALSNAAGERNVDPAEDLRPVCPNCHYFIHSRQPMYSIEDAQSHLI